MGFEYQRDVGRHRTKITYTDEVIDSIYKQKSNLKVDVANELEALKKLLDDITAEYERACEIRDSIADWDSQEAYDAEDACNDLWSKQSVIEDWIDNLEDLYNIL